MYELAAQRLFFDYVFQKNTSLNRTGYLEYLPQTYEKRNNHTLFCSAFKATALANFARRCNSDIASDAAFGEYGKAIQLINAALIKTEQAREDETLLACQLLGYCEVCLSKDGMAAQLFLTAVSSTCRL